MMENQDVPFEVEVIQLDLDWNENEPKIIEQLPPVEVQAPVLPEPPTAPVAAVLIPAAVQ